MTRSNLPYLIIAVLLLLFQLLYVKFVEEPYPAILAPGFGVLEQEDEMVILWDYKVCIKRDGQCEETVSLDEILPTVPRHMRVATIQTLIDRAYDAAQKEDVITFLRLNVEHRHELHANDLIVLLKVKLRCNLNTGFIESSEAKEIFPLNFGQ